MSTYPYDNDYELVQALGKRIGLKRFEDLLPDEDIILHNSRWWRVTGEGYPDGALELEIAGPSGAGQPETSVLAGDGGPLVVFTSERRGLQFVGGVLQDVSWPGFDLIHVRDARARGLGADPDEKVHGIFILRYEEDGDPYYAPADQEYQPGVASSWILRPERDLILDWEPVDVMDLLERMQGAGEDG